MEDPTYAATYDPPIPIRTACRWCSGQLAVNGRYRVDVVMQGLDALSYVHAESGQPQCYLPRSAQPYDGWAATRAFRKAQAEADRAR